MFNSMRSLAKGEAACPAITGACFISAKKLIIPLLLLCVSATAQITSFPYVEDFETGPAGWTSVTLIGGDSWQLGTPDGTVINQAAPGGTMSWYVDTLNTGTNEQSHIISPEFDFTNLPYPTVQFDIWWDLVFNSDAAVFQSSVDGGSSWQNVGHHDDDPNFSLNWFNHAFISMGFPNGGAGSQNVSQWTGDDSMGSLGWVTARHVLDGLGGESSVMLRLAWINKTNNLNHPANGVAFDNIQVYDALPDLAVNDVEQAWPCGGGYNGMAYVSITNFGAAPVTITEIIDDQGNSYPITSIVIAGQSTSRVLVP